MSDNRTEPPPGLANSTGTTQSGSADSRVPTISPNGFLQKGSCDECGYRRGCPAMRGRQCRNPIRTWVALPGSDS